MGLEDEVVGLIEGVERKKMKKKKKRLESAVDNNDGGRMSEDCDRKKRKRDVNSSADKSPSPNGAFVDSEDNVHPAITNMLENDIRKGKMVAKLKDKCNEVSIEMTRMKKKKEKKSDQIDARSVDIVIESLGGTEGVAYPSVKKTKDNGTGNEKDENVLKDIKPRKWKRVQFADELSVLPDVPKKGNEEIKEVELIRGKRFSKEEDEIIKEAVYRYIERHDLGDEGLNMVLNCKSFPTVKGCWKEIGAAIPLRPRNSVYVRAQKLFRRSERYWTEEQYEFVRMFQKKHGNRWAAMAEEIGKSGVQVFNAWLGKLKLPNRKIGRWSQDEYQTLFNLVNIDLQLKVSEEKKSKHGMLRDNVCWIAISEKLATRNNSACCFKWYRQLTSPMVAEGKWRDADDYRLIGALYDVDASSIENVDWDNLLDHRPGEVSLQRWKQMIRYIGKHENKSFAEQVEILAQRYCPYLFEAREAWDNKPYVL